MPKWEWRPIETIPEETRGDAPPVVLYHPGRARDPDFPGLAVSTSNPVYAYRRGKTDGYSHWMPLPEAPERGQRIIPRREPAMTQLSDEVVERVARALCLSDSNWEGFTWEQVPASCQAIFLRYSRTAIAAYEAKGEESV